jgi:hypothetical protein
MSIGAIFKAAGIIAGGAILTKVVDKVADGLANSSLNKVANALNTAWQAGAGQNYVSKTKSVRVEPYCLIDSRAVRLPFIKDVMNVAQRQFTSLYLLSVASDNTISGVKVSKYLDKFAPDRDLNAATANFLSTESYQLGLPFVGEAAGLKRWGTYSTEDNSPLSSDSKSDSGNAFGGGTSKLVQDIGNLAIGQIVDVTMTDGQNKATIPVLIKLRPLGMEPVTLVEMLSLYGPDSRSDVRWRKYRLGEIELLRDLVAGQDRIDAYRRAAMADKSGYFRKAHQRADKSLLATLLTGTPSIGDVSSICIIGKETQRELEEKMGGRFTDFNLRQRMFEGGILLLLYVVDSDMETVTVYTRDIEDYGIYTLRDIKSAGPQTGNGDLTDVMKSYLEGRIPGRL